MHQSVAKQEEKPDKPRDATTSDLPTWFPYIWPRKRCHWQNKSKKTGRAKRRYNLRFANMVSLHLAQKKVAKQVSKLAKPKDSDSTTDLSTWFPYIWRPKKWQNKRKKTGESKDADLSTFTYIWQGYSVLQSEDQVKLDAFTRETEIDLVAKKNATSVIWRYFDFMVTDTEQKEVLRKTCKAKMATSRGNTPNLYQHLKQHREKYEECMTLKAQSKETAAASQPNKEQVSGTNQSTITDVFASITPYAKSSQQYKEITDAITQCLARVMIPIYTVSK
ncbi:uncharacterized protein LOC130297569 [Hyla sarda]|uniref:uncharacterized protein LOC130297569 n=1 Tax=Hyla sarda TaxID=327740 RepID=UPI0024C335B2|nr:uncharacterized protein LOC130297569 [Hyla sarda]